MGCQCIIDYNWHTFKYSSYSRKLIIGLLRAVACMQTYPAALVIKGNKCKHLSYK